MAKKLTGVSLREPQVPRNIKAGETNRMSEENDKETSSVKARRNTVCLCYVIVADGGRLGKSGKGSNTAARQKMDRKFTRNKVCAKKFIQLVKILKRW